MLPNYWMGFFDGIMGFRQFLRMQVCFNVPGPPYFFMSIQWGHALQLSRKQLAHW